MAQKDNTKTRRKTQTSKGLRKNAMKTSDMNAPFVSGNLSDEKGATGRVVKLFVTSCDGKRMRAIKANATRRSDENIRDRLIERGNVLVSIGRMT